MYFPGSCYVSALSLSRNAAGRAKAARKRHFPQLENYLDGTLGIVYDFQRIPVALGMVSLKQD
jgi:hypothetical protein